MLRPSRSAVSGLGSDRPSRVPMPAARITTWTGARSGAGAGSAPERGLGTAERPARSAGMAVSSWSGRTGRDVLVVQGEEAAQDPVGGVPVLQVAEGPPEGRVAGLVLAGHVRDVTDRPDELRARVQQRSWCRVGQAEVEAADLVAVAVQVVGEQQDRPAGDREVEHRGG